ncbi:MAG TPA: alpha/beta fold hydrolase [Gemmataceae bacterium]|nr:alpha/beta fold hydrolase [Gemmataceae bacterium]
MRIDLQDTRVGLFNFELLRVLSSQASEGAEIGECVAAMKDVRKNDTESWTVAWNSLADRTAASAERFLQAGQTVSARGALFRASTYYQAAVFYVRSEDPRFARLSGRSQALGRQAARLCNPPIEVLEIPFGAHKLPGYFLNGGSGRRPTLIALGGFDSTGEELIHWIGFAAAQRGWNCLIFEGPGQWSALRDDPALILRPDYEVPVKAVVDYAVSRADVDVSRLALIGYSLGGLLAPRAAAFDPRIRACIANPPVIDVGNAIRAVWPAPLRRVGGVFDVLFDVLFAALARRYLHVRWFYHHARWSMGIQHPHEFFETWRPYTLHGLETKLRQPLLCLFTEDEIAQTSKAMVLETMQFLTAIEAPVAIRFFSRRSGAASHCQMGGLQAAQASIFDWLDDVTRREPAPASFSAPHELIEALERYHGKSVTELLDRERHMAVS